MNDKHFREWIQLQKSCLSGKFSEWLQDFGEWWNPACHVRRAGSSGMSYKAPFACIPLTTEKHAYQHQNGELACLLKYTRNARLRGELLKATPIQAERMACRWFDGQLERHLNLWLRHTGQEVMPPVSRHQITGEHA